MAWMLLQCFTQANLRDGEVMQGELASCVIGKSIKLQAALVQA